MADGSNPPPARASEAAVIAHMNMLQGIINRLATSSASCKTWCLSLVAALLSLAGATRAPAIVGFALLPVLIFGYLDIMYLSQERAYRRQFNHFVDLVRTENYTLAHVFDARATRNFGDVARALASWSVGPVYLTLIAAYFLARHQGYLTLLAAPAKSAQ